MSLELTPITLGSESNDAVGREITISTWNVWFDRHHREERNRALLAELGLHKPQIMVFQEVTMPFIRAIQACEWLRDGYWISAVDHNQIGVVMVSRVPVRRLAFHPLTSQMGRRLLVAEFPGVTVASCHFESNRGSGPTRREQFLESIDHLRDDPAAVLLGDFNCTDQESESEPLSSHFVDAWESAGEGPGYTLDSKANKMAWREARADLQVRIDRLLLQGDLEARAMDLLGTEPFQDDLHASDHFGLLARLVRSS